MPDPQVLGYFSLPAAGDSRLVEPSALPEAIYTIRKIQTFTMDWEHKVSAASEQTLSRLGTLLDSDAYRMEVDETKGAIYRLTARFNLPLQFIVESKAIKFGDIKEYWTSIYTNKTRYWALNTKADATGANIPIKDLLEKSAQDVVGARSTVAHRGNRNSVFLALEDVDGVKRVCVYLKAQYPTTTMYARLEYESDRPLASQ